MTCNTAIDYGDQDEWTPYIAFPLQNAKEIFLSYPMKCRPRDHILPLSELCPVFRKRLLVKLTPSVPENLYDNENINKQLTEKPFVNQINTLNENFQSEKTREVWSKLRKSCDTKSRTRWQDSLENGFFLKTLEVKEKSTSCDDKNTDVFMYNLQRCGCKDLNDTNKDEGRLDKMTNSDEECSSPCLCPKYFISKSGVVFGSLEEKQCFDEKMEMMDEVFKSELITIKEQHERLREDLVPKLPDNDF